VLQRLLEIFRSIPEPVVIAVTLLAPTAETAILLGILVPGELVVVAAGILASRAGVSLAAVLAAAVAGAIAGDSIGFFMGQRFRDRIKDRLSPKQRRRAQEWLTRKGPPAIFLARFTPFLRSVMPAAAGASKLEYRVFLAWNVPAGILWAVGSVFLGYFAARQSAVLLHWIGGAALVLAVAFIVYARLAQKKRRASRRTADAS
jgi:membrane protein DedA with SNARE-associated domain